MISRYIVQEPPHQFDSAIVFLCGRNVPISAMYQFALESAILSSLIMVIEPQELAWYPAPNGALDQNDALNGIDKVLPILKKRIEIIKSQYGISEERTAIVGYSAGGVMALKIAEQSNSRYAGVISICGCILDPQNLKQSNNETPIVLIHNKDDYCFDWEERYLPTKKALIEKNYNVSTVENERGGHDLSYRLSRLTTSKLKKILRNAVG